MDDTQPRDAVDAELPTWMAHLPAVEPDVESARQRIRRLSRLFDEVIADAATDHDMSVGDLEALSVLARADGELLPGDIARTLGITSGSTSLRLHRLTRAGLVEPAPRSGDGRSRPVRLTERGRQRWRSATDQRTGVDHALVTGALDPAALRSLNDLLAALLGHVERELGRHAPARGPVERVEG
ncbi:MarR family winged helix-turn-helix transcriptional regulator [Actinomycetospora sp. C-140]